MPLNFLLSFHFYREPKTVRRYAALPGIGKLFADSGAFSAWAAGAAVQQDDYAKWLEEVGSCFSCAAALDVIGDPRASFENAVALRKRVSRELVKDIVPVVHANDADWQGWLARNIDAGFDYIGIAPSYLRRSGAASLALPWLRACFARKPEHVRYHGFAVTSWPLMSGSLGTRSTRRAGPRSCAIARRSSSSTGDEWWRWTWVTRRSSSSTQRSFGPMA